MNYLQIKYADVPRLHERDSKIVQKHTFCLDKRSDKATFNSSEMSRDCTKKENKVMRKEEQKNIQNCSDIVLLPLREVVNFDNQI